MKTFFAERSSIVRRLKNNLWLAATSRDIETLLALKGRRRERALATLSLRGLRTPVLVRPNATDVEVVWELFGGREYEFVNGWPFKTVLDCGANVGLFLAWVMRESKGRIEKYVGVEPDDEAFTLLRMQASMLGVRERALVNAAVWSSDGTVRFDDEGPSWAHTVRSSGGRSVRSATVSSILDEAKLERVDLAKIDIEGGEKVVLQTLGDWGHRVDVIVTELHGGLDDAWFAAQVKPHGFQAFATGALFHSHCGAIRIGSPFLAALPRRAHSARQRATPSTFGIGHCARLSSFSLKPVS